MQNRTVHDGTAETTRLGVLVVDVDRAAVLERAQEIVVDRGRDRVVVLVLGVEADVGVSDDIGRRRHAAMALPGTTSAFGWGCGCAAVERTASITSARMNPQPRK